MLIPAATGHKKPFVFTKGLDADQIQIKPPLNKDQAWSISEIQRHSLTQADSISIDVPNQLVLIISSLVLCVMILYASFAWYKRTDFKQTSKQFFMAR